MVYLFRNFIDIGSGKYWNTSQANPWVYADYIVLERSSTQEDRAEPTYHMWGQWQSKKDDLLARWQSVGDDVLRQSYHVIYENEQYDILKRGRLYCKTGSQRRHQVPYRDGICRPKRPSCFGEK